ncbi:MAG: hypothetical protein Q9M91_00250 [Candidatus Dojkabacteria bacterium]|nr:hypothetical protein [Candidatus Dojkabacteria bacterium]
MPSRFGATEDKNDDGSITDDFGSTDNFFKYVIIGFAVINLIFLFFSCLLIYKWKR